ncbi:hypothetical protein IYC_13794, partial [Clostridium sporogenes PA 3679]
GAFKLILIFDIACTFMENKNNIKNSEIILGNK